MIRQGFKQTQIFFVVYNADSRAKENLFAMPVQEFLFVLVNQCSKYKRGRKYRQTDRKTGYRQYHAVNLTFGK